MKHIWSVLCSRMITDRETNSVSLQNVIEELRVQEVPKEDTAIPIEMSLASLWMRDDVDSGETAFARFTLTTPSQSVLGQWESEIDLTEYRRVRFRLGLKALPANEPGVYTFQVDKRESKHQQWKQVAESPLVITFVPSEEEE